MRNFPECYGIIPARYESSRFPGKPLADICGWPMFWHVFERAKRCSDLHQVVLATDDDRIADAARKLDVPVVMTRHDHSSGTDRVFEAAGKLGLPENAVVLNIQGDEPVLDPDMLSQLTAPFENKAVQVTTLAKKITAAQAADQDLVKVVLDKQGRALYFSRAQIPFARDARNAVYFGHIGLYAFRMATLKRFVEFGPTRLEKTEKLEQLRLLENGIPIHVVPTTHTSIGVDRPEDLARVIEILKKEREDI